MTDLVVRPIRAGDEADIARMHLANSAYYAALAPELFRVPDDDGLLDFLAPADDENSDTTLALVAEVDGELAGMLYAHLIPPRDDARFQNTPVAGELRLFIDALGTFQSHWRRGVATALVEAAEDWGRERGVTVVECDTWHRSPVSLPFWQERMGYDKRSVRMQKRL
jgi:GNAT superfamily N-acetyltransferase